MYNRTIVSAANTLTQMQQKIDNISNNLSNTETTGYKAKNATFGELLYQQYNNDKKDEAPRQTPLGIRIGVGSQIAMTKMNEAQGELKTTNRYLDFAIGQQSQYFNVVITNQNGETENAYTRDGNFKLSPANDGTINLTDNNGNTVLNSDGDPIVFKGELETIKMLDQGQMRVTYKDGTEEDIEMGITKLKRPDSMIYEQGNYLVLPKNLDELDTTEADMLQNLQGDDRQTINVQNGVLEASNVDTSFEMTNLIEAQRAYQFSSRNITMADQMMGLVNSIRS